MSIAARIENVCSNSEGKPITIGILESAAAMGGIQQTTLALVRKLDRTRWNPIVICPEDGDLPNACRSSGVRVEILPLPPMLSTSFWIGRTKKFPNPAAWAWDAMAILAAAKVVADWLRDARPKLIVTKGLLCHFYGALAARYSGVPCLWYVQDLVSPRFGGVYQRLFGQAAKYLPTDIAAIGPQIVAQLPAALRDRARVLYNAVDVSTFGGAENRSRIRDELGVPPGAFVIGQVARLTPWKGQHHLLEAFSEVAVARPSAHLVFIGAALFDGARYEAWLRQRVSQLGLDNRVTFAGHRRDVVDVLGALDLFAYCAVEKDICNLSLLEAMASRLPVVAFDIPGVRDAIVSGEEGVLVPAAEAEPLANEVVCLHDSPELRARLGRAARERVQRQFSLDRHVDVMEEILLQVLSGRGLARPASVDQTAVLPN
jgi:glycosyltransferase involved in cell wall biosynthesis